MAFNSQSVLGSIRRGVMTTTIRKRIMVPVLGVMILALALNTIYSYRSQRTITLELMETVTQGNLSQMVRQIEESRTAIRALEESLGTNYLRLVRMLAAHIARDPSVLEQDAMAGLAATVGVPEIHVSDGEGILRWGNVPGFYGYRYDSDDQSTAFVPAIRDPAFSLVQDPTPRGVDAELFQYIGVARVDEPGIIQIGVQPRELEDLIRGTRVEALAGSGGFGQEGFFLVTDTAGVVLYHPEVALLGRNLLEFPWARPLLEERSGDAVFTREGTEYYAAYREIDTNRVVAIVPVREFTAPLGRVRFMLAALLLAAVSVSMIAIYVVVRRNILSPVTAINQSLDQIAQGDLDCQLEVLSRDEFGLIGEHFNAVVTSLDTFMGKIREILAVLSESTNALGTFSQETSATSAQQASAAAEIVSTMEDLDALSKAVERKMLEASEIAAATQQTVNDGFLKVKENLSKIDEINVANATTISGITFLSEKIRNIGDIVNLINGIADQTKIIAFNAELEASSSGEGGENFQIVATEIRRLADSTVKATKDIRQKITEIQSSSDKLMLASQEGTTRIQEGSVLTSEIQQLFQHILAGAEKSGESTRQIAGSVNRQVSTFEQVLIAIQQISAGVKHVATAADNTAMTANSLDGVSENLRQILSVYRHKG